LGSILFVNFMFFVFQKLLSFFPIEFRRITNINCTWTWASCKLIRVIVPQMISVQRVTVWFTKFLIENDNWLIDNWLVIWLIDRLNERLVDDKVE
jgi:hypothetical protein